MLAKTESFWGYSAKDVIVMPFAEVSERILKNASPLKKNEIIVALTKRRTATTSAAERLACNRIMSALVDGPDVLDY